MNLKFMKYAIALGYKGLGTTLDNPSVGAVIVKNNKVVGMGFTQPPPGKHAEIVALEMAGKDAYGAEMYVTLEPCSFVGRTPACAPVIVSKGIKKVYIGSIDPNPKVAGKGIEILKKNNITVVSGILKKECDYLHRFFFNNISSKLPYITVKFAQTIDGFIARENGDSKWISNDFSRKYAHKLRKWHDAVLVGYNTFINDNPSLNIRYNLKGKAPLKVLLWSTKKREINYNKNLFKDEKPLICVKNGMGFIDINKRFKDAVDIVEYDTMEDLFFTLRTKYNINSILVEGGAIIAATVINKNLFNELDVFIAPKYFKKGISPYSKINCDLDLELLNNIKILDDTLMIYKNRNKD